MRIKLRTDKKKLIWHDCVVNTQSNQKELLYVYYIKYTKSNIPKITAAMYSILTTTANQIAHTTHFVHRRSKLDGALFAQTLVFGWWSRPQATLEELADISAVLGCDITPQAIDQRFNEQAATFLGQLLAATVRVAIASNPVAIPLMQRFEGVYLSDSSLISLPKLTHCSI